MLSSSNLRNWRQTNLASLLLSRRSQLRWINCFRSKQNLNQKHPPLMDRELDRNSASHPYALHPADGQHRIIGGKNPPRSRTLTSPAAKRRNTLAKTLGTSTLFSYNIIATLSVGLFSYSAVVKFNYKPSDGWEDEKRNTATRGA